MERTENIQEIWIITHETESNNVNDWFNNRPALNPRFFFNEASAKSYFDEIKHMKNVKVQHNKEITILTKEELDWQ